MVLVVMLAALVLALPNFFGEAPALQLSRKDRGLFESPRRPPSRSS